MSIFIGLNQKVISNSSNELSKLLASTYTIYLQTQNYHWNVVDKNFYMLHSFFEDQYKQLTEALDEIAERLRMLGKYAPAKFSEFLKLATISENEKPKDSKNMIMVLLKNHETIIAEIRNSLEILEDSKDVGTIDLFIERLRAHEKMSWMLRSHLT